MYYTSQGVFMRKTSLGTVPEDADRIWFINLSGADSKVFVNGKERFDVMNGQTMKLEREKIRELRTTTLTCSRKIAIMITTQTEVACLDC